MRILGAFGALENRFVGERTEHRVTLLWTDIIVIRPENLVEFVLIEKS